MEVRTKVVKREFHVKTYICKFCKQEFIHSENLYIHLEHHKEKQKEEESCNIFNIFNKCA